MRYDVTDLPVAPGAEVRLVFENLERGLPNAFTDMIIQTEVVNFGFEFTWRLEWLLTIFWTLLPLALCAICHACGTQIRMSAALCSALLFTHRWPVATGVRSFIENRGSRDLIRTLKSGFVIPFLVGSLGLPLLRFPSLGFNTPCRKEAAQPCACWAFSLILSMMAAGFSIYGLRRPGRKSRCREISQYPFSHRVHALGFDRLGDSASGQPARHPASRSAAR